MPTTQRFQDKIAVVTGGASGIGLAITRRLVQEGARVVIADVNDDALARVSMELGAAVVTVHVDVRIEAEVAATVSAATEQFGGLDLGFNAAGVTTFGPIHELEESEWDRVVDICLKGTFLSVKHEARTMIAQGRGGAIVNIASVNARLPMYGGVAYTCSKAGVEMLSRTGAREMAEHNIRINTVSPGLTDTPLSTVIHATPGMAEAYLENIPMGRWGTPEDMAAAALFLASDDAGYITGTDLVVDGAWMTTGYPDLRKLES